MRNRNKKGRLAAPFLSKKSRLRAFFRCSNTTLRQFFLDTCRLARTLAQLVQLGATDVTTAFHFDRSDQRGVQLEGTLDAFAGRDLANDEVRVQATVTTGDDDAFVRLSALARTFDDVNVDDHGIARCKIRNGFAQASDFFLLELLNQIHFKTP